MLGINYMKLHKSKLQQILTLREKKRKKTNVSKTGVSKICTLLKWKIVFFSPVHT